MKKIQFIAFFALLNFNNLFSQIIIDKKTVINKKVVNFSNSIKKDTFYVKLIWEDTVRNGEIYFFIKNFSNKIIFDTLLSPAKDYLGYEVDVDKKRKDYILEKYGTFCKHPKDLLIFNKIEIFLNNSNFQTPALGLNVNYFEDLEILSKVKWLEIQKDQTSISYSINIYDEGVMKITYDKKRKKVIEF